MSGEVGVRRQGRINNLLIRNKEQVRTQVCKS